MQPKLAEDFRLASHSLATMLTRETLLLVDLPAGDFCSSNGMAPQDSSEIKHGKLGKHHKQIKVGGELPFRGAKLLELRRRKALKHASTAKMSDHLRPAAPVQSSRVVAMNCQHEAARKGLDSTPPLYSPLLRIHLAEFTNQPGIRNFPVFQSSSLLPTM